MHPVCFYSMSPVEIGTIEKLWLTREDKSKSTAMGRVIKEATRQEYLDFMTHEMGFAPSLTNGLSPIVKHFYWAEVD